MARVLPAMKPCIRDFFMPDAAHSFIGIHKPCFKSGKRSDHFERGPWWVNVLNRFRSERAVGII